MADEEKPALKTPTDERVTQIATEHNAKVAILIVGDGKNVSFCWVGMSQNDAATIANEAVRQLLGL